MKRIAKPTKLRIHVGVDLGVRLVFDAFVLDGFVDTVVRVGGNSLADEVVDGVRKVARRPVAVNLNGRRTGADGDQETLNR